MTEEEKKEELPPIEKVACSEADFKANNVDTAWAALKEEAKIEDDAPLSKDNVKKWWETSLKREPFTDEDFTALFDAIPKAEEGKDEVKQADAEEHLMLRAISIKLVPSRLNRDFDSWHE